MPRMSDRQSGKRSPPTREAWIEIAQICECLFEFQSPPTREAWIEMEGMDEEMPDLLSPPTREAWIEISSRIAFAMFIRVASHPGGVD